MADWDGRALVESEWLAAHLADDKVRIVDSSIVMRKNDEGNWQPSSGRAAFEAGHISGAQFVDLMSELMDRDSSLNYTLPPPADFAAAMAEKGIGDDHMVVV